MSETLTASDLRNLLAFSVAYADEPMRDYDAASARVLASRIIRAHGMERLGRWADYVDPHDSYQGHSDREVRVAEIEEWAAGQVQRLRKRGVRL
jgi:hypothetical protein